MLSMLDSELKRFHDRIISPYDYSIYFRIIDLVLATLVALLPLAVRDLASDGITPSDYSTGGFAVINFMIVFALIGQFQKVYDPDRIFDATISIRRFVLTTIIAFFVLLLISVGLKSTQAYSRLWFFSWMSGYVFAGIAIRLFLITHVENQILRGNALRRALVVTIGQPGQLSDLSGQTGRRFRLVGHLELANLSNTAVLESMARRLSADMIIVEAPWRNFQEISENVAKTFWSAVQDVYVIPVFDPQHSSVNRAITVERIGNQYLFQMKARPIGGWNDKVKRIEDVIVSILAIVVMAPVLVSAAIAIKLSSPGPILFRQMRQGFAGETFEVWKFRTMDIGKSDLHATRQTSKDDPRVTRVGSFLRRTSIDELPQFFNVLQGSMSVVGPRPHALGTSVEGRALHEVVDRYESRFRVKPGITGWAQVSGWRGELTSEDKIRNRLEHDQFYIENWSIYFDLKIILLTIMRVLHDPRAY